MLSRWKFCSDLSSLSSSPPPPTLPFPPTKPHVPSIEKKKTPLPLFLLPSLLPAQKKLKDPIYHSCQLKSISTRLATCGV